MELESEQKQAQKIIRFLIQQCWKNEAFKKKLLQNPIRTIEKVTGKPSHFPKGVKIAVEDQSDPNIIYFNLPAKPVF